MKNTTKTPILFFKSINIFYHLIGFGGLAILIIKVIWLNDIPAPFTFMVKISPVIESILGSIIASYIFYVLCIHPSIFKEMTISSSFVNCSLNRVVEIFEENMKGLSSDLDLNATTEDIALKFSEINPFLNNAPLAISIHPTITYSDWFLYFKFSNDQIQEEILKLINSRLFIDIDTTSILNTINDCFWFTSVKLLSDKKYEFNQSRNPNPFNNPALGSLPFCHFYYELKEVIKRLKSTIEITEKTSIENGAVTFY